MHTRTEKVHAAELLRREGWPTAKIARTLGQSERTVREWFQENRNAASEVCDTYLLQLKQARILGE